MLYKVVDWMLLTLYGEKFLSTQPCVSFRLIENTGAKGRYVPMARRSTAVKRTFSAARLSDILRGSYRLQPQSPASSQCMQAPCHGSSCTSSLIVPYAVKNVKRNFSFFHKIFLGFLGGSPCGGPGHDAQAPAACFIKGDFIQNTKSP